VTPIKEKIKENWLRWYKHMQRRLLKPPARRTDCMVFSLVKRGRKKPKRKLEEIIKRSLMVNNIP